jgi:hypothetical protein
MLSLIGKKAAPWMTGRAFLGEHRSDPRPYIYGTRNRIDETAGCARSITDGRYLYTRRFLPTPEVAPMKYFDVAGIVRELRKPGVLNERDFVRWSIAPACEIVARLRQRVPGARIIGFPKGAGLTLDRYVSLTKVDGIGLDWTVPLGLVRRSGLGGFGNDSRPVSNRIPLELPRRESMASGSLDPNRFNHGSLWSELPDHLGQHGPVGRGPSLCFIARKADTMVDRLAPSGVRRMPGFGLGNVPCVGSPKHGTCSGR